MEVLISMKAEYLNKGIYFENSSFMQMPTAQTAEKFIADFREGDKEKLKLLNRYVEILEKKLNEDDNFQIEHTNYGFKLLKPVDQDKDYIEEWDKWVVFATSLLNELKEFIGEKMQEET